MSNRTEILIGGYPVGIDLAQDISRPRVACLGPKGTYTEQARNQLLRVYLNIMDARLLERNEDVVQKVDAGEYDIGIVPVNNAIEGDVLDVKKAVIRARNFTILGESILSIQHVLLARSDANIEEIHSHPQALGQCRGYLLDKYPGVKQVEAPSTTAAAIKAQQNEHIAAIGSRSAAQIYGLALLAENIGDSNENATRFLMIGRGETNPTGRDTTSLIFIPSISDRAGILEGCLHAFSSNDINLSDIQSSPTGIMRQHAFFVEIDGHAKDENVKNALDNLRTIHCSTVRLIASYRKAMLPEGSKEPGVISGDGLG